jgi:HSP20 family protein
MKKNQDFLSVRFPQTAEKRQTLIFHTMAQPLMTKKYNQKEKIMTNIIKNRNASPAAFGSVLDQLFPKNVTTLLDDALWGLGSATPPSVVPVNILETKEGYEIELSAPGFHKSDFHLNIEGDTLTVSCQQQTETAPSDTMPGQQQGNIDSRWVCREFIQPSFKRHFELGEAIDRDKISARYDNGILYLTLPKKENVRPASRQININ